MRASTHWLVVALAVGVGQVSRAQSAPAPQPATVEPSTVPSPTDPPATTQSTSASSIAYEHVRQTFSATYEGDVEKLRRGLVGNTPEAVEMREVMIAQMRAIAGARQAWRELFGADSLRLTGFLSADLRHMPIPSLQLQGEDRGVVRLGDPRQPLEIPLHLVDGYWQMDLPEAFARFSGHGGVERWKGLFQRQTELARALQGDLEDGVYPTPEAAAEVFNHQMVQSMRLLQDPAPPDPAQPAANP